MDEPEEDFASMFEASVKAKRFETGQTLEGTIVAIGPEVAFVDVGGKGEATIEIAELKDEDGNLEVAVGDRIQATVVSTAGGLTLSRKLVRGAATQRQLESAFRAGLPVEGKVEREVKGGYEVRIARQRAFCPFSQIDTARTEPSAHLGRVYEFRIVEYTEGGKNLVVSRRALLEETQRESAAETRRSIVAGAVMTGRVTSVRPFGAFVDLGGGVQGLLHVSEMGWSRVSDPVDIVKPGEEIVVKVLRVDEDKQKISLGLKQLAADPWSRVEATYEVGQVRTGARHARRGVRRLRRARAGHRRSGARLHVRADGPIRGLVRRGRAGHDRGIRDPEHRSREEADRRRAAAGGLGSRRRGSAIENRRSCPARASPGRSSVTRSSACSFFWRRGGPVSSR